MPYNMRKVNGKFCVFNSQTHENKGCSDTRPMAIKHMRALYAAEGGASMGKKEIDLLVSKSFLDFLSEFGEDTANFDQELQDALADLPDVPVEPEETPVVATPGFTEQADATVVTTNTDSSITYTSTIPVTIVASEEAEKAQRQDVSEADKKRATEEYGNVKFADPENKKYPIDTETHIRAAWSYINMPKNAAKYSSSKVASIKRNIVSAWKSKISKDGPPQANDKEIEWDTFVERVALKIKALLNIEDESDQSLLVWKEGDQYRWITRYSNNFRDEDYPPEIISERSHRQFIDDVEKGLAPYPELWLWHVPEWKLGQADWLAWDDSGFALAAGHFYKGREAAAEWLSKQKGWGTSHGMLSNSIARDEQDSSVIVRHTTREISPLPLSAAANKRTGFVVLTKEADNNMAIPAEKRKALKDKWGLKDEVLDELEAANAVEAQKAVESGVERKEVTPESPEQTPTPEITEPVKEETPPAEAPVTRQEIAEAIAAVVVPQIEAANKSIADLNTTITTLQNELKELKQADVDKIAKQASEIPAASLSALVFQRIVNQRAEVKENDPLKNAKPKETPAQEPGKIGIDFLDKMLAGNGK